MDYLDDRDPVDGVDLEYFRDVIAILTADHRAVEELAAELDQLREATDEQSRARRAEVAEQLATDLARHATAEEVAVYPRLRERAGEAEPLERDHIAIEKRLRRWECLRLSDPGFEAELRALMAEVRKHVAEEEGVLFPRLRAAFSKEELVLMGQQVQAVKEYAPPRPRLAADPPE